MSQTQQITHQNVENGHEEIPLNRLNNNVAPEENTERRRMYNMFTQYDTDNDGYLRIRELKGLINSGGCQQLPKGLARHILHLSDTDGDGRLDFTEFYEMSQRHQWLFREYLVSYCRTIIPSPHRETGDQIDGAYERQMTVCPPPLTMITFSIIEIIMFLVDIIYFDHKNVETNRPTGESTDGPAAQLFIYNPYRRYEAWRFLTYMFVHIGVRHICMNLIIQVFLGVALELVHHWWRVTLVYIAGVVAGSMSTSLATPRVFLAGASGGVYALITAHIATIIMNWSEMEYAIIQLFVFLIFCFTDLGSAIYHHATDPNDQVGYVAHLGGAIAGLLVGFGVLRNLKVRRWEKIIWWISMIIFFALMSTGILVHIFYYNYFPEKYFNKI